MTQHMTRTESEDNEGGLLKRTFRSVFIAIHKPGPMTIFLMLSFIIVMFIIAYGIGNWI